MATPDETLPRWALERADAVLLDLFTPPNRMSAEGKCQWAVPRDRIALELVRAVDEALSWRYE